MSTVATHRFSSSIAAVPASPKRFILSLVNNDLYMENLRHIFPIRCMVSLFTHFTNCGWYFLWKGERCYVTNRVIPGKHNLCLWVGSEGLVVKLYGDQKGQRHLPSSVHTMASWLGRNWGIKETTKVGWFQVLTLSILVSTAFTFLSVAFFDWGRETRTAWHDPSGCLTLERIGAGRIWDMIWTRHSVLQVSGYNGHSGTLWNWSAFTSWSHLKNLINLFDKHLWQVDRYIYRICICV